MLAQERGVRVRVRERVRVRIWVRVPGLESVQDLDGTRREVAVESTHAHPEADLFGTERRTEEVARGWGTFLTRPPRNPYESEVRVWE